MANITGTSCMYLPAAVKVMLCTRRGWCRWSLWAHVSLSQYVTTRNWYLSLKFPISHFALVFRCLFCISVTFGRYGAKRMPPTFWTGGYCTPNFSCVIRQKKIAVTPSPYTLTDVCTESRWRKRGRLNSPYRTTLCKVTTASWWGQTFHAGAEQYR